MNLYSSLALFTSGVVFFGGAFIFSKDTKDHAFRLFLIYTSITAGIAFFEYLLLVSSSQEEATDWLHFELLYWPILYVVQFHFLYRYAGFHFKSQKLLFIALYIVTISIVVWLSFFNIFESVKYTGKEWIRFTAKITSTPEIVFAAYMSIMTIAVSLIAIIFRRNASRKKEKLKADLVLAGILIPTWGPFLKNGILPSAFNISILFPDFPFIFIGWSCLVVAILYFQMFDLTPKNVADKILATMNEAMIMTNIDGKIIWTNKRFYELFELDADDIDDKNIDLMSQVDLEAMNKEAMEIIGEQYKKEELKNIVIPIRTFKNNSLYVGFSSAFLKDNLGEVIGVVILINDINELILAQQELKDQQMQMLTMAHQAGMSEVTTSVMHNIGNILNSVNISSEFINMLLSNSKLPGLLKANNMLLDHRDDLANFITDDPKGKLLPDYYFKLGLELSNEQEKLKSEGKNLFNKIKLIKDAIDIQQDYSLVRNLNEPILLNALIDEVITILEESFKKNNITVQKEFEDDKKVTVIAPASKLFNILLNVMKNASESVKTNTKITRLITIKIQEDTPGAVQIIITDNGIGIPSEVMPNIFKFGFTTKQTGHGYGLHFCANVLKEMNGSITASSNGQNQGAEFRISIPKKQSLSSS